MNNKSIFSLISFFLLSMFYVASASAGPTYVNIKIPKECGTWKKIITNSHNCAAGPVVSGVGGTAKFICGDGGDGKGKLMIQTQGKCGSVRLAIKQEWDPQIEQYNHGVRLVSGKGLCVRGCGNHGVNGPAGKGITSDWVIPTSPRTDRRLIGRKFADMTVQEDGM
jgi:hypothetical protein